MDTPEFILSRVAPGVGQPASGGKGRLPEDQPCEETVRASSPSPQRPGQGRARQMAFSSAAKELLGRADVTLMDVLLCWVGGLARDTRKLCTGDPPRPWWPKYQPPGWSFVSFMITVIATVVLSEVLCHSRELTDLKADGGNP